MENEISNCSFEAHSNIFSSNTEMAYNKLLIILALKLKYVREILLEFDCRIGIKLSCLLSFQVSIF